MAKPANPPKKEFSYEQITSAYQSRYKPHAATDIEICGPCPICKTGTDRFHIGRGDTQTLIGCRKCPSATIKDFLIALGLIDNSLPRQRRRAKPTDNYEPVDSAPQPEAEAKTKPQPKPYIPPKRAERWDYLDIDGVHRCSAFRVTVNKRDGTTEKKMTQAAPDGKGGFLTRSMPPVRPLLYSPDLAKTPSHTPILVVEGEKCADFAREQGQVATTWIGGVKVVERADFGVLAGRPVTLWPDNDAPGRDAMDTAARRLIALGCKISLIAPPSDKPEKWDCADCDPDEFARILETAAPYEPPAAAEAEAAPAKGLSRDSRGLARVMEIEGWALRFNKRSDREEIDVGDGEGWQACSPRLDLVLREHVALKHRGGKEGKDPLNFSADGWAKARAYLCDLDRVDPVREWLEALPPKPPANVILNTFGECFRFRSDEYSIWIIEALWIGVVERIMEPGCPQRVMPVILGDQDTGKSSFVRSMLPPELYNEYYQPRLPLSDDPQEKVHKTHGVVLAECGELSGSRKVTVEDIKAHLDLPFDRERLKYAHHAKPIPRGYYTIGTANRGNSLPEDDSNSRYAVLDVEAGKRKPHDVLPEWRNHCWRQALDAYRRGERRGFLPDHLKQIQRERNQAYDRVDEVLANKVSTLSVFEGWATINAIMDCIGTTALPKEVGSVLLRAGYRTTQKTFPGVGRRRAWLHPDGNPRSDRLLTTLDYRVPD